MTENINPTPPASTEAQLPTAEPKGVQAQDTDGGGGLWISASERLPEVGAEVLLWAEAHPHAIEGALADDRTPPRSEVHMGECRDSGYGLYLDDYAAPDDDHYITHWMPHPAGPAAAVPPSGKGKGNGN